MKNLKLLCGILIGLTFISSCKSDDDSTTSPLIGTWKAIKQVEVCSTGSEDVYELDECEQRGRVIFFNNGTISITEFTLEFDFQCEQNYSLGSWSHRGDDLTITMDGITQKVTFFELTNNVLRLGGNNNDPDFQCAGGNLVSHYYTEYERVE